ncbi:MAG: aldehyde dehydrogenase family protein [Vicinamibacterales bacterium]
MTSAADWPCCLAGEWRRTGTELAVRSPWDGRLVGRTWLAGPEALETATRAAVEAAPGMARLAAHERAAILRRVSAALAASADDIARTLAAEAGKPLKDARTEVDRARLTFSVAADESLRIGGEFLPLDVAPPGERRFAVTRRVPLGPVAGISPFNFPLNLVAHKLAPAVAAGDPIVLKPATRTPLSALTLARLLVEAGLPPGGVSVLPLDRRDGDRLVTDDRFRLLTFTGSSAVGWDLKARAGRKRVVLELGGNAGLIVDRDAPVDFAVTRLLAGGFGFAGQSCISVQRVFVHADVFDAFAAKVVTGAERLVVGDPLDPATDLGPLITEDDAARTEAWVQEAVAGGATVLTGGRRLGRAGYAPTVLTGVPAGSRVCAEEAFAPVVVLERVDSFEAAIDAVNASRYGLQAGVFTRSLPHALAAFDRLEVGGVIVNDVPSWRIDPMPYGGVKDSGLGREGPRYAIEDMTELRLLVVNQDPA